MAVTNTTDAQLLLEVFNHRSVILKYLTEDCGESCKQLLHVYEKLSDEGDYADIVFLRINAEDNPVAKEFIRQKKQPIVTIYHKGRLIESDYISTPDEMISLLKILKDLNKKKKSD